MKLLALTPWPFIPARSGGTERCYNLLKALPEVTAYALDWSGKEANERHGNITYRVIPADDEAVSQAKKLMGNGLHSWDGIPSLTQRNLTTIKTEIAKFDADLIILEHPWLIDLIGDTPFIYDAHNFEAQNSQGLFGTNTLDIDIVRNLEARALREAEHITYCSEADWLSMKMAYKFDTPGTLIPNGADRQATARGFDSRNLIFIGSLYAPNIEAANNLIALAPQLPEYTIQILGPCATAVTSDAPNVQLIGAVTDKQRDQYFDQAHQFVNLIWHGSGTHLKIARALSHGLPVVTTPIGARGYSLTPIGVMNAVDMIRYNTANYEQAQQQAIDESQHYDWATISQHFAQVINGIQ